PAPRTRASRFLVKPACDVTANACRWSERPRGRCSSRRHRHEPVDARGIMPHLSGHDLTKAASSDGHGAALDTGRRSDVASGLPPPSRATYPRRAPDMRLVIRFALAVTVLAISARSSAASTPTTPIQHLVVIFQENVSFDHYFGTYPIAANTGAAGEPL